MQRLLHGQQRGLMVGNKGVDDLVERLSLNDLGKFVKRQVDAVIADTPLREIVGADALGTVAAADLPATFRRARCIKTLALGVEKLGAQQAHGLGTVAVLRSLLLHHYDDA